jgi:hypothetical protein
MKRHPHRGIIRAESRSCQVFVSVLTTVALTINPQTIMVERQIVGATLS